MILVLEQGNEVAELVKITISWELNIDNIVNDSNMLFT